MARLTGKKVLVTGASSGIGEGIAIHFAAEGASVAINYHSGQERAESVKRKAEEAAKKAGANVKIMTVKADVSKEADVNAMFDKVIGQFGGLDILINNSGIQKAVPSEELPMEEFDRIIGTNLRGAFNCARQAIRHFLSRPGGGVIVNNSSVHEMIPKPTYLPYSVSKGGLENMTRTLALEYAERGIRVIR